MIRNALSQLRSLHIRFGLAIAFSALIAMGAMTGSNDGTDTISTLAVPVEAAAAVGNGAEIAARVSSFLPGSFK
jgi:hypothetical protein